MARVRVAVFVTLLMMVGLMSAVPTALAEGDDSISWGIEYEWVNLNGDINALTGLPYDDIIADIEDSATYAGFDLQIVNVYSGITSFYVEQWDDSTEQQVTDNSGTSHTVTTRMTEITLRHGMLYDAGILMDWDDNSVMGAPSLEMVLSADYETIAVMDLLYTEYVTSDMMLVGADLDASGNWGIGAGMGLFVDVSGNGDSFDMDLDLSLEMGWDASSITSEWRLENPSNILNMMDNGNDFDWECDETQCGKVTGSYSTVQSYDVSFTGLPMDEFGFDADALDMQISDSIPDSGTFDSDTDEDFMDDGFGFEMQYEFGDDQTVTIDDAGTTTVATELSMDPYPPGMSLMVGYSFVNAIMGSGDQTNAAEAMATAMENWAEDAEETVEFGTFVCDDGEEIPADYVNDGEDDCSDGSDEGVDEGEIASELENKAMNIGEAFEESDFLKNMETFGERLGSEMEKYQDLELEIAYVDGEYNALWSNEHSRYVGMQLIGETEAGNEYSVLGPETNAYNNNPPTQTHLVYLVGEAADVAEDNSELRTTIEDLAPIAEHDVSAVIEALGIHAPEEMISDNSQSDGENGDSSFSYLATLVAVGLGALLVLIVLGAVVMLVVTRKRGGSGEVDWNTPVEPQLSSSEQQHTYQEQTMQPAAAMAPTATMPSTLPTPQNPPANIQGTMQQGHEVLEWPAGSGSWWFRDQNTGQWAVWQ
ncbi:MAG: low-density lipoprotein receptor class A repeat-containing protein [Candidatus Thalassarchaeaceae archaeon]|nr:low-density lipoprotein receptor class A repeat-containing protein [Candidatus Thalassarchaeaceae archaeon]